jgi:hypothetical protein
MEVRAMNDRQAQRLGARRDAAVDNAEACRKLAAELLEEKNTPERWTAYRLQRAAALFEKAAQELR